MRNLKHFVFHIKRIHTHLHSAEKHQANYRPVEIYQVWKTSDTTTNGTSFIVSVQSSLS
jgi:hypothetical protein